MSAAPTTTRHPVSKAVIMAMSYVEPLGRGDRQHGVPHRGGEQPAVGTDLDELPAGLQGEFVAPRVAAVQPERGPTAPTGSDPGSAYVPNVSGVALIAPRRALNPV